MSGERIFLVDGADGTVANLVRAASIVAENAGVPVALIGGLAVMCRVATGQRATGDVDLVSDAQADLVTSTSAADNLVRAELAVRDPGTASIRLWVGSTKVEIIETVEVTQEEAADIEPERNRLFVLGHRWALETATPVTLSVVDTDVVATIAVAEPAALVAMKLHSIQTRNEERKRASDAWDLFRLLRAHNTDGRISKAFADGPVGLYPVVANSLSGVFDREATRTRRWVVAYGDPRWAAEMEGSLLASLVANFVGAA